MINWKIVEEHFKIHTFYHIDNKKSKTMVLFGNCHLLPVAYFFNIITKYQYNIIVILSWFYERTFSGEQLINVNKKIRNLIITCDYLIYQKHFKSYQIDADVIQDKVNPDCKVIKFPNLILDCFHFDCNIPIDQNRDTFHTSVRKLTESIMASDFRNFIFIVNNLKSIRFFNTKYHPTHYLLYLLSIDLYNLINLHTNNILLNHYNSSKLRKLFLNFDYNEFINLPDKWSYNEYDFRINDFNKNQDYFDINF